MSECPDKTAIEKRYVFNDPSDNACCAHKRVEERREGELTVTRTWWECVMCGLEFTPKRAALSEAEGERWIEQALREEWWFKHGCAGGQYGDDGEMQCCMIDFKRTPIHELREIVEALRLRRRFPAPPKEKP